MKSPFPSFKWISAFSILLLGYFTVVSSGDAQGSIECDRQTFSPVNCPASSEEEETNNEDNDAIGNIEEQIPTVIPFP
ncbi:MAG TPA: hypothetical protein VE544_01845 [Nitrososphaeraceae archaeon]|nr:hypothetical protein [Nitrososphaeraceae archaeon]